MQLKNREFNLIVRSVLLITIVATIFIAFFVIGIFLLYPIPENFTNILLAVLITVQLFIGMIIVKEHDTLEAYEINKKKR